MDLLLGKCNDCGLKNIHNVAVRTARYYPHFLFTIYAVLFIFRTRRWMDRRQTNATGLESHSSSKHLFRHFGITQPMLACGWWGDGEMNLESRESTFFILRGDGILSDPADMARLSTAYRTGEGVEKNDQVCPLSWRSPCHTEQFKHCQ